MKNKEKSPLIKKTINKITFHQQQGLVKEKKYNYLSQLIRSLLLITIFLVPIFFLPLTTSTIELNKVVLLYFLVLIATILCLIRFIKLKQEFLATKFDYLLLFLAILLVICTIFSVDKVSSLIGQNSYYHQTLTSVIIFLLFIYLIINNFTSRDWLIIFKTFILSAFIGSFLSLLQLLQLYLWPWQGMQYPNFTPFTSSYNNLLVLSVLFLVFGLNFLLAKQLTWFWRLIGALLSLIALIIILLLDINLGWWLMILAMILWLLFMIIQRQELKIYQILLPTFLLALAIVFLFINVSHFSKIDFLADINLDHQNSWRIVKKSLTGNYLLGSGPENFNYDFNNYRPQQFNDSVYWQLEFNKAASEFWQLLSTWGPFPLLVLIILVVYFYYLGIRSYLRGQDIWLPSLILIACGLIIIAAAVFTTFSLVTSFILSLFFALGCLSFGQRKKKVSTRTIQSSLPAISLSLLVVLTIVIFFFTARVYNAEIHFASVLAAINSNNWQQASHDLESARNSNPYKVDFDIALASLLTEQLTQLDPQVENYQQKVMATVNQVTNLNNQALSKKPKLATVYTQTANIYTALGAYLPDLKLLAIENYQQASQYSQKQPINYIKLGQIYYQQAQILANQLAQLEVTNETETQRQSLQTAKDQALSQAESFFTQATDLKTNFLEAQLNLALTHEQQGQSEAAQQELEELVVLNPVNIDLRFELGNFYLRAKKPDLAEQNFLTLTQLFPENVNAHIYLAEIYKYNGKAGLAQQEYQTVLQLDPENQLAQKALAELSTE